MRPFLISIIISLVLFFVIYPSAFIAPSEGLPDNNDTRLIAYIIGQQQDNFLKNRPLYYARFFAPFDRTLTFSEPFITSALLTLPVHLFTKNPIIIFNIALIGNFALTFLAAFILFKFIFGNSILPLLGSLLFNLSGFHLAYLPHLQMFSLWPFLMALYFFIRRSFFLFLIFVTLQMAESIFPVYLIFFSVLAFFITSAPPLNLREGRGALLLNLLPFLPLWMFLLLPYLKLPLTFPEAIRPIRDAAHFSLGLEEVFTKYHSWTIIIFLIISFFIKSKKKLNTYYLILVTGLILSLGPVLKISGHTVKIFSLPIPLPYALFYYLFPGFKGFRTPSRFIILSALAAAIIVAARLPKKPVLYALIISFLLLEAGLPRQSFPVNITLPAIYQEVKKLPEDAIILELPIKLWNMEGHQVESIRSLYSLEHGRRRLGGFSGFAPFSWIDLVEKINANGLDPINTNRLRSFGVTHVIENNRIFSLP